MGAVVCFQCISHNSNVDDNYGHLNVDINNQEPNSDQYMNIETKVGTFGPAGTLKNKKTLKIDKGDFVRLKADNIFEEYDLKEKLGEGAYGCVYKVIQRKTNYLRAVKAIKKKMVDKNEFMNEIEVLKTVDHPNIIKLFDCYYDRTFYYMVEEYCSGGDLFDYIQKEKCFTEKKAKIIFKQLLSAVNHLHKKNIVHRDLKPENIVFIKTKNNDIFIKIIDFGASITFKGQNLSQELGTIYYIAPEVFMNNYNEKADIWSCGIILYTMLCGHPPFCGKDENTIKAKILHSKLVFPTKNFKNVSTEAIDYLKLLLAYNPENRPSAEEALENCWLINESDNGNIELSKEIISNLSKFRTTLGLQKVTISFLANQVSINDEIKALKEEFDKFDVNKDGEISKEELIKCLEVNYPYQEAVTRANHIFNEIDFNNDGSINFSEFLTVNFKKEKLLSEDTLEKTFHLFDIDGNGFITLDELKESMPIEITSKMEWSDLIEEVDKDGDGQISLDEFKEMMRKLIINN
jgi:calcium-dependent protein kinase